MNKPIDFIKAEKQALRRGRMSRIFGTGLSFTIEAGAWAMCLSFVALDLYLVLRISTGLGKSAIDTTLLLGLHGALLAGMLQSVFIAFTFGIWRRMCARMDRLLDALDGQDPPTGK